MILFAQGDIIKISGYKIPFLIISKNAFIQATGVFHVCPIMKDYSEGPLRIKISGRIQITGIAVCEQVKMIDPIARNCVKIDSISYETIMNISDAIQGMFEYD